MKECIVCGIGLSKDTTTWYRQKNYIHKCNDCIRTEKREQARKRDPKITNDRSKAFQTRLREKDPREYTARQQRGSAKKRAAALGLEFSLTNEYIKSLYPDNCPILGVKLKYGGGERGNDSPALDRIDPNLGYVEGNVQVISFLANLMKSNSTPDEMLAFADWVYREYWSEDKGVAREK